MKQKCVYKKLGVSPRTGVHMGFSTATNFHMGDSSADARMLALFSTQHKCAMLSFFGFLLCSDTPIRLLWHSTLLGGDPFFAFFLETEGSVLAAIILILHTSFKSASATFAFPVFGIQWLTRLPKLHEADTWVNKINYLRKRLRKRACFNIRPPTGCASFQIFI